MDQYLRAIAKRALPIFQSNNFVYLPRKNYCGKIPTEDELFNVLKELYTDLFIKKHKRPKLEISLGRFTMLYEPDMPMKFKVLLDIDDHEWRWYPEKVFKQQEQQDPQEQIMEIERTRQKEREWKPDTSLTMVIGKGQDHKLKEEEPCQKIN